jgi:AcrR family transcriptional regulator
MKTRRPPTEGDVTRSALVEAAEELFANFGFDGVSIRQVNAKAGCAASSSHYHFGSKERLHAAVIQRLKPQVQAYYAEHTAELRALGDAMTIRDVVEFQAAPLIQILDDDPTRGVRWLKVVAALPPVQNPDEPANPALAALRDTYPQLSDHRLTARYFLAVSTLYNSLAHTPTGQTPQERRRRVRFHDMVIDFVAAGLEGALQAAAVSDRR